MREMSEKFLKRLQFDQEALLRCALDGGGNRPLT